MRRERAHEIDRVAAGQQSGRGVGHVHRATGHAVDHVLPRRLVVGGRRHADRAGRVVAGSGLAAQLQQRAHMRVAHVGNRHRKRLTGRSGRSRRVLAAELAHQHLRDAQTVLAVGQAQRELLVEQLAIGIDLLAAGEVAAHARVRLAHGLEHHLGEDRLELLGHRRQRALAAVAARLRAQLLEAGQFGPGVQRGGGGVQRRHHITSLRSPPGRHAVRRPVSAPAGSRSGRWAWRRPGSPRERSRPGSRPGRT